MAERKRRIHLPPVQLVSNSREDVAAALEQMRQTMEIELVRIYTEMDRASAASGSTIAG